MANDSGKEMVIGKKRFFIPDDKHELRELFTKVIEDDEEIRDNVKGAACEILIIYPNISKTTIARVVKTSKELKFFTNRDYLIEFSGDIYDMMAPEQRYYVMMHELLHIRQLYNFKMDTTSYKLCDHDVKDFAKVIKKAGGIDWFLSLKDKIVDIHCSDAKIKDKDTPEVQQEKTDNLEEKKDKMKGSIKL